MYFLTLNEIANKKFYKLVGILSYLSKFNIQSNEPIEITDSIFIPNEAGNFEEIFVRLNQFKNEINHIGINSNAIEMLYSNKSFDFNDLLALLDNFSKITINIKSSINNFYNILNNLASIKKTRIQI